MFSELSNRIIGCAIEVHRELGPGLLESTYEQCLAHELSLNGIDFKLQHPLPVEFKGVRLDCGYRVDVVGGRRVHSGVKERGRAKGHTRGATADIHEIGRDQAWISDQLQRSTS